MRVLVTGAAGMVGGAVSRHLAARDHQVLPLDHAGLDIADRDSVIAAITREKPDVVINCAAWTDVDGCESNAAKAYAVNAQGPENLAVASRRVGASLLTISTDYVFDGLKQGFYTQRDDPNPQSVYAASKLEGERRAQMASARTIVIRTGFIFGPGGKNFLSILAEGEFTDQPVRAISDAVGTPTYASDLARRLLELAELDLPGVFHVVNGGSGASYLEFASAVAGKSGKRFQIEPVTDASLGRAARRPANSRLKCLYSEALGLKPLRTWEEALAEFVSRQAI